MSAIYNIQDQRTLSTMNDYQHGQGYSGNLRYYLAKKKLDTLFMKWLKTNKDQIQKLFMKAKNNNLKALQQPNPLFSHHRVPYQNLTASMTDRNGLNVPKEDTNKKMLNNQSQLSQSMTKSNYFAKTIKPQISSERIPQFYFPQGKMIDSTADMATKNMINSIFGNKIELQGQQSKKLITDVIGLPNYFSISLLGKCTNIRKITRNEFNKIWKQLQQLNIHKRAFNLLLAQKTKKYLTIQDFKKLFKQILNIHPGLQFLKQSPEFQQWYSICVINRIFFMANKKNDYQMSYREFKKSRILQSLIDIQSQPDINLNKDFFSYQDFYVIYIKFWELDNDHDFFLTKDQLSKYSGYTLSRKTIQRIYSQVGRKFQHPQKMTFGDFTWFIYCVQDKTTEQSIEYWFKILDLDNNGIIAGYQLQFFYEEQSQRLAYMDSKHYMSDVQDILYRMDLFKPQNNTQFTLDDFLKKRNECGLFINFLTDLNKLVAFDQRDAYQEKSQKNQHPQWTQWDRFVKPEYKRVQNTGEEGEEMLNWEDDS